MRRVVFLAAMAACSGSDKVGDTDTDVPDTDEDTTDETDETGDTTPPEGAVLTGRLVDIAGSPVVSGVRVQYCRGDACMTPDDFEGGTYTFQGITPGFGSFEVVPLGDDPVLAPAFVPIELTLDQHRQLDATIPNLNRLSLPPGRTELELAPGLWFNVAQGDLDRPTPFEDVPTTLGAVDATDHPLPIEGVSGTVLALWYMGPFNAPMTDDVSFRIVNRWGVTDGQAELWYGDYLTATWIKVDDLDESDGDLVPLTGAHLPQATTLLLLQKL